MSAACCRYGVAAVLLARWIMLVDRAWLVARSKDIPMPDEEVIVKLFAPASEVVAEESFLNTADFAVSYNCLSEVAPAYAASAAASAAACVAA